MNGLSLGELAANWTVSFAVGLALLFFVVKMVAYRRLSPVDVLAGLAELPSDISAACLSLAAAYLWLKNADAKVGSLASVILTFSFLVTTCIFRYVDDEKLDFLKKPIRVVLACIASYVCLYFLSIRVIIDIYSGTSSQ